MGYIKSIKHKINYLFLVEESKYPRKNKSKNKKNKHYDIYIHL